MLHIHTQCYNKCVYADYDFTTPTTHLKHDDSHVYETYKNAAGEQSHAYGQIRKMFVHEMYPGGPSKVALEVYWFQNVAKCRVSGNRRVLKNYAHHFNTDFTSPVHLPGDVLPAARDCVVVRPAGQITPDHPLKNSFAIITRNQAQAF